MDKIMGQVALLGAIGGAAYLYEKSTNDFKEKVNHDVIAHQVEHRKNVEEEHSLESYVSAGVLQECRAKLKDCLENVPMPENCQQGLNIDPYTFYKMYGDKGINEGFSLAAANCYNKIAENVDTCESEEVDCLRFSTGAYLKASLKVVK